MFLSLVLAAGLQLSSAPSFPVPEMVEIEGAETLGFSKAGRYEVTWREYGAAVAAGACRPPIGVLVLRKYELDEIDEERRTTLDDPRFDTDLAVDRISVEDMHCYVDWLGAATGRDFALPTETQWRWLAYGGATTQFPWGDELEYDRAYVYRNSRPVFDQSRVRRYPGPGSVTLVGQFAPNRFGLHDVIGNAAEFLGECEEDVRPNGHRTFTCLTSGGASFPDTLPAPQRYSMWLDRASPSVGFRLVERDGALPQREMLPEQEARAEHGASAVHGAVAEHRSAPE